VVVAVKQDAQFVVHPVVATVAVHVAVPVYPAEQAVQVRAAVAIVHAEHPTTAPVAVVDAGVETPVAQLMQLPAELRTNPDLQTVQVATAALHKKQLVSVHVPVQPADPPAKEYPGAHVVHVVSAAVPPLPL